MQLQLFNSSQHREVQGHPTMQLSDWQRPSRHLEKPREVQRIARIPTSRHTASFFSAGVDNEMGNFKISFPCVIFIHVHSIFNFCDCRTEGTLVPSTCCTSHPWNLDTLGQRPANRPQSRAEFSANSWECRTCNQEEGTWDWTARFHHVRTVALHQPRPLCCRWTCRNTWGCRAMGRTIPRKFIELPTRSPDAGPYKSRLSLFDQRVSTAAPSTLILLLSAARRGVPAEPSTAGFSAAAPAASCTHGIGIGCSYP